MKAAKESTPVGGTVVKTVFFSAHDPAGSDKISLHEPPSYPLLPTTAPKRGRN